MQTKKKKVTFDVDYEVKQQVKIVAKGEGLSEASYIRQLMMNDLKAKGVIV